MRKILPVFFLVVHTALCFAAKYDDILIEADNNPSYRTSHGYFTYKIKVTNVSATESHQVELRMPEKGYGYQVYIQELSKTIVVPPHANIEVMMLQPPVQMLGSQLDVIIDGHKGDPVNFSPSGYAPFYNAMLSKILVSQSVRYDDVLDKAKANLPAPGSRSKSYGGPSDNVGEMFLRSNIPVDQWDKSWINYSCFDSVIVSNSDMTAMGQDIREAIYEYVSAGGSLLVLGEYSDQHLKRWPRDSSDAQMSTCHIGFGVVQICADVEVSSWSDERWKQISNTCWEETLSPFASTDDYEAANNKFPIADISVPVRGLFALVLVFAITIGPANLIVLSRWKKRIWLLWTVPLMSFVTCVTIFAYSIFAEGWTAYSRTLSITILDQRDHKATTLGWQAFYSPLSPGDGLHYDLNTEITMLGIKRYSSETRPCRIDFTSDQHLQSGFLKSRVPAHFMIRKCQISRQRVVVETDEKGALTASNGLGANIKKFYYVQKQGDKKQVYHAEDIGAGTTVNLEKATEISVNEPVSSSLRGFYRSSWPISTENFNTPQDYIETQGYVAYCDQPLFIEQGFKGAKPKQSQSVIIGVME